jgi:hypothetical protein
MLQSSSVRDSRWIGEDDVYIHRYRDRGRGKPGLSVTRVEEAFCKEHLDLSWCATVLIVPTGLPALRTQHLCLASGKHQRPP